MPTYVFPIPSRLRSQLLTHGVVAAVAYAAASAASGPAFAQSPPTVLPPVSVETQQTPEESSPLKAPLTSQSEYGGEIMDTPQSITVVTEELMDEQHVTRMRDALRNVPGISLGSGEGGNQGDTIFLRGFNTRGDMYLDGVRDFGDLRDIQHVQAGIAERLPEKQPRLGPDRFPEGIHVARIDESGFDTEAGQGVAQQVV